MPAFRSPSRVPSLPSAGLAGVALLVLATGVGCEPSPPLPSPATDPAPGVEAPPYRREPCLTGLEDGAEPPRWASSPASSSLVLVPGGDQLVVVDEDAEQLIVGTRAGGIWHRVFLAGRPHHVVIDRKSVV